MPGSHAPDLHDGLDATQRRVLSRLGDAYAVSADIVDNPAQYEALIGLAQPFRRRYPLVDGRGNFGSVDEDPPADPVYTEARLTAVARTLPRFPNLLVNGSAAFPPHNLREAVAAVRAYLDEPGIDLAGLMAHLPGPDFPTGGEITDPAGVEALYETGAGAIEVRARAHVEGDAIVVTELPFTVSKGGEGGVIREIVDRYAATGSPPLANLEDHSDRHGMRIVITLKQGADPQAALAALLAHTSLRITLRAELVALVDGTPRRLTLRELIRELAEGRDPAELQELAERFGDVRRTAIRAHPK